MACERPILLPNPKGGSFKAICGTCRSCLIDDIKDWTIRLENEQKHCFNGYFVTLTYSDDFNPGELQKEDLYGFFKTLRHLADYKRKKVVTSCPGIRYFAVGEYGEHYERPHYHMILFNIPEISQDKVISMINQAWGKGFIQVDEVNRTTIQYVCKYIFKQKYHQSEIQKPFRTMSTRPGIGSNYIKTHLEYHNMGEYFFSRDEAKIQRLPKFYLDRIFDDEYKERRKDKAKEFNDLKQKERELELPQEKIAQLRIRSEWQDQQNLTTKTKMSKSKI